MKNFYLKIILPTILSILLFLLTIFLVIIPQFQEHILNGKREMIKELTNAAVSILSKYENDETEGLISREQAQKTAISRINYLRYGDENKDYFWITDMSPTMIIHPFRPDLNGKDLSQFTDPHGKKMFIEFVETVRKNDHGYVDYMWQWKDDSLHIVPKLSYVKLFKPWNWIVGTGIYIEDVKKEISRLTQRLLYISLVISFFIALLLFYITKQSLNIERKRREAEIELQKSNEKYLTLVEAATEGLIMLSDGKISFSNSVISKITGFDNAELVNLSLYEIINKNNNNDIIEAFSGNTMKDGRFELNLNHKNGGFVEVLLTSSTTMFYGKIVNIIIVKDISSDKSTGFTSVDYQKLISTLNVGFFKASISSKGKFLFANETAIKILGFNNFNDLTGIHVLRLIATAEERKSVQQALIADGFIKNKVLQIKKNNGENAIVSVSLILLNKENPQEMVCDGIIEDITGAEMSKKQINALISSMKAGSFLLEQPLKNFLQPLITLKWEATIGEAAQLMLKMNADIIVVSGNQNEIMGVISSNDLQKRVLRLNLKLENPAYLIMSSPVVTIAEHDSVFKAMSLCSDHKIGHLIVKNALNAPSGIFSTKQINESLLQSLSYLTSDINTAQTVNQLKQNFSKLNLLIKPLIESEMAINYITQITSTFSDAITKRIIALSIEELGAPPADFSFICLGSEGRSEETLLTDQDNAIIFDDVSKDNEDAVRAYFLKLGEMVCDALHQVGYTFCKGQIMAKNPQWCTTITEWKKFFAQWIALPEPQHLLDATIFFDFRTVSGNEAFADSLRQTIHYAAKEHPAFLYHMAYNSYSTKPQQIASGNILSDKNAESVDLKSALIPIIMFARTYSLQNEIDRTNTIERLTILKERKLLSETTIDNMLFDYKFLMKLRFKTQLECLNKHWPITNVLQTKMLLDIELQTLKKVLSHIPEYQNKVKADFRITT